MSNNFSLFLLFSTLVTGLVISPAFAQENTNGTTLSVNATQITAIAVSSNSTSTEDDMNGTNSTSTEDDMNGTNSTSTEDDMNGTNSTSTEDDMAETEDETVTSPLKQIKEGTLSENVICKEDLQLVFKLNGQPACVKTTSIQKLTAWGWIQ